MDLSRYMGELSSYVLYIMSVSFVLNNFFIGEIEQCICFIYQLLVFETPNNPFNYAPNHLIFSALHC